MSILQKLKGFEGKNREGDWCLMGTRKDGVTSKE